jgi:diadenosine tetraphosphate (Ap4A) HIT family hydrolase
MAFDARACDLADCCRLPVCEREVRNFAHWQLKVHSNQGYLGRCVLIAKRADASDLADATPAERDELFEILRAVRAAVIASPSFRATWLNYAFLGNDFKHLHAHIVPRYDSPRTFAGLVFTDELFGHHYRTTPCAATRDVVLQVRDALRAALDALGGMAAAAS